MEGAQQTIGIVGGGQLGRMLTLAALPLGFKVVVVDPGEHCPAAQVGAEQIVGSLYDEVALKQLAEKADYITVEIEHLDTAVLEAIAKNGVPINPAPSTIQLIQDKFEQKKFFAAAGIPVAPFTEITDRESAIAALKHYGGSMIIKTRHGAYDGRGNMVVRSSQDVDEALATFEGRQLYAEALIDFERELAVMVARSTTGEVTIYPITQTIHERNICVETLTPAPVDTAIHEKARAIAKSVATLLQGSGTFGIEMFLTKSGDILVNEIAPRVHNSGHYTTEAIRTSQFEQHIRAIAGLPLGSVEMLVPAAVMVNILGKRNGPTTLNGLAEALAIPGVSVHLYGKSPTKIDRKMGHITATGATIEEARKRAEKAERIISV